MRFFHQVHIDCLYCIAVETSDSLIINNLLCSWWYVHSVWMLCLNFQLYTHILIYIRFYNDWCLASEWCEYICLCAVFNKRYIISPLNSSLYVQDEKEKKKFTRTKPFSIYTLSERERVLARDQMTYFSGFSIFFCLAHFYFFFQHLFLCARRIKVGIGVFFLR